MGERLSLNINLSRDYLQQISWCSYVFNQCDCSGCGCAREKLKFIACMVVEQEERGLDGHEASWSWPEGGLCGCGLNLDRCFAKYKQHTLPHIPGPIAPRLHIQRVAEPSPLLNTFNSTSCREGDARERAKLININDWWAAAVVKCSLYVLGVAGSNFQARKHQ